MRSFTDSSLANFDAQQNEFSKTITSLQNEAASLREEKREEKEITRAAREAANAERAAQGASGEHAARGRAAESESIGWQW